MAAAEKDVDAAGNCCVGWGEDDEVGPGDFVVPLIAEINVFVAPDAASAVVLGSTVTALIFLSLTSLNPVGSRGEALPWAAATAFVRLCVGAAAAVVGYESGALGLCPVSRTTRPVDGS